MIVAVARRPPRRDAVDQLAPVGENDAAALGPRDRQWRPAPFSSAHRATRYAAGRPAYQSGGRPADWLDFDRLPTRLSLFHLDATMPSFCIDTARITLHPCVSTDTARPSHFPLNDVGETEDMPWRMTRSTISPPPSSPSSIARQLRRTLVETDRLDGIQSSATAAGCSPSPATTISTCRSIPRSRRRRSRRSQRYGVGAGASRLVTGNHPLFAELEEPPRPPEGHRGGLRVRLRLSRQCRHHPGADRRATIWSCSTSCRMPACGRARQLSARHVAPSGTTTSATPRRCCASTAAGIHAR